MSNVCCNDRARENDTVHEMNFMQSIHPTDLATFNVTQSLHRAKLSCICLLFFANDLSSRLQPSLDRRFFADRVVSKYSLLNSKAPE